MDDESWRRRHSVDVIFTLFGGLSTSVSNDLVGGKVGFSHGGLDFLFFVADPAQPLDGNLRATFVRIASTTTAEELDRHHPLVVNFAWGNGNLSIFCKMLALDTAGKKMPSVEDMSRLFGKLKVSAGGGHLSDGTSSICVAKSDV